MPESERRPDVRGNVILALVGLALGAAVAAGYGAWRAVSLGEEAAGARWSEFGEAMLFPGSLIVVVIAAVVWLGWKANIG